MAASNPSNSTSTYDALKEALSLLVVPIDAHVRAIVDDKLAKQADAVAQAGDRIDDNTNLLAQLGKVVEALKGHPLYTELAKSFNAALGKNELAIKLFNRLGPKLRAGQTVDDGDVSKVASAANETSELISDLEKRVDALEKRVDVIDNELGMRDGESTRLRAIDAALGMDSSSMPRRLNRFDDDITFLNATERRHYGGFLIATAVFVIVAIGYTIGAVMLESFSLAGLAISSTTIAFLVLVIMEVIGRERRRLIG